MNSTERSHILFHPEELAALFAPDGRELAFSPAGLDYLGVISQTRSNSVSGQYGEVA